MTPGGIATVRLLLPPDARPNAYWKTDPATGQLARFDYDGSTGAVIAGNVVTLRLQDGGRGDADGLANGVIVDPGGPGATGVLDVCSLGSGGWTVTQSGGTASGSGPGTVTVDGEDLVMREGNSFLTTLERPLTLGDNIALPSLLAGASQSETARRATALATRVGIAHRLSHYPQQVSGGEMQRAAIARALVHQPSLLIARHLTRPGWSWPVTLDNCWPLSAS